MNKKEINEIKKNFTPDSGLFSINRVMMSFVDGEGNVRCTVNKGYHELEPDEAEVIMETLKKTLSGTLGKNLSEYPFPNESYTEGGAQHTIYAALKDKFENEETNRAFIERVTSNYAAGTAYALISAVCTYTVIRRAKDDTKTDDDFEHTFMVTACCPSQTADDGLYYNGEEESIFKKINNEMIISKAPQDGFFYPVFSDRQTDINSVMYYTKSPKKPNLSMVEDVLDCTFVYTCEGEKERFRAVLTAVCGEELDYGIITSVNDIIEDVIAQNQNETEPPVIDAPRMKNILAETGISDERISTVDEIFEQIVGEGTLRASNLVESKVTLAASAITVNVGKDATDKVRTSLIGGRKCLVIDLDDPNLTINGIDTTVDLKEDADVQ
ncbi:MAG: DUF4317 domain-containing protein [Oscillospiraceae bacterium]|nr:DUF4317 domain-containing protein [Oscillospiraceae bacterium]